MLQLAARRCRRWPPARPQLDAGPVTRARRTVPLWRRARRVLLVACLFCLAVAAISWLPAVTGSRNLGLGVASVEWLRSHGGNPIVSQIENWYYTLNEPEKGGPALTSLPQVGVGAAARGGEGEGAAKPPTTCPPTSSH